MQYNRNENSVFQLIITITLSLHSTWYCEDLRLFHMLFRIIQYFYFLSVVRCLLTVLEFSLFPSVIRKMQNPHKKLLYPAEHLRYTFFLIRALGGRVIKEENRKQAFIYDVLGLRNVAVDNNAEWKMINCTFTSFLWIPYKSPPFNTLFNADFLCKLPLQLR